MVHQLQLRHRLGNALLIGAVALLSSIGLGPVAAGAEPQGSRSNEPTAQMYLGNARSLYQQGQYFRAARYAFAAIEKDPVARPEAYSWVTLGLAKARLYNSASYFFIKTLQSGNKEAIRRVLTETQNLLVHVGPDLLRKYLIRHTQYEDYDSLNRSAYLYALGKDALLAKQEERAIQYLSGINKDSPIWPFALQLRASAHAIRGNSDQAIADFKLCRESADGVTRGLQSGTARYRQAKNEAEDLEARCTAGEARSYYQAELFEDADRTYDSIQKTSLVWPDILFEQAWNGFARQEYNRSLGKLVSYKSPALTFVFNPEIDVLRAQSALALCLYMDANDVINEFNGRYAKIGEEVKQFVESRSKDPDAFYEAGKAALRESIYSKKGIHPMLNRFVRGPYFTTLVRQERDIASELEGVRRFGVVSMGQGSAGDPGKGFPGFLGQVLAWRKKSARVLGGMFVKNSLIDYHAQLIGDFEKMAFIKLEMLKRAKDQLVYKNRPMQGERGWGNQVPSRKDYQYYWSFNGEFWNDELGDYVFGLESQCRAQERT